MTKAVHLNVNRDIFDTLNNKYFIFIDGVLNVSRTLQKSTFYVKLNVSVIIERGNGEKQGNK